MSLSATILKKPANNLYFIEKIKKNCVRNGQRTFLVKWQGFPHRQPIWEPEENIFPNKAIDSQFKKSSGKGNHGDKNV